MVICLTETTLFYHLLRLTDTPVSHPTAKYGTGLIATWADKVTTATSAPHGVTSSATLDSLEFVTKSSTIHTDSPRFADYQPRGLELDNEDEILAYLDPEHETGPAKHVTSCITSLIVFTNDIVPRLRHP
jgi:hypothetical protein